MSTANPASSSKQKEASSSSNKNMDHVILPSYRYLEWRLEQNHPQIQVSDKYIASSCGSQEAIKSIHYQSRKAEKLKHRNCLDARVGATLKKIYMDGNFIRRMVLLEKVVHKREISKMKKAIKPIMIIYDQLVKLERNRTESQTKLDICLVRVGKRFEEETADLLSFNDVETENIDPMNWKEQTVTVKFHVDDTIQDVGIRRIKAIGNTSVGKGKRKKRKSQVFDPYLPESCFRKNNYQSKRETRTTLPWTLTTSERPLGCAPEGGDEEKSNIDSENDDCSTSRSQTSINSIVDDDAE